MNMKSPLLPSLPWVLLLALAVVLAAFLVLYLVADPGARIPPDVGYG